MSDRPVSPYSSPAALDESSPAHSHWEQPAAPRRRLAILPLLLYLACCASTWAVGGPVYAVAIMGILTCHEAGHYFQARRYGVPASLPFFIPMPISPIGTMGAVIAMRGHIGDRRALYDIGISGPLAGLVPTLICCYVGLSWSTVEQLSPAEMAKTPQFNEPLLFGWMITWFFGPLGENQIVMAHSLAYAGWVGLLITALNLVPIGQLDGGHILYALLRRRAHAVAWLFVFAAGVGMLLTGQYFWSLMLILLVFFGPEHPPTANDDVPLGTGRIVLGWLTLAFVIIGFTPVPFTFP